MVSWVKLHGFTHPPPLMHIALSGKEKDNNKQKLFDKTWLLPYLPCFKANVVLLAQTQLSVSTGQKWKEGRKKENRRGGADREMQRKHRETASKSSEKEKIRELTKTRSALEWHIAVHKLVLHFKRCLERKETLTQLNLCHNS